MQIEQWIGFYLIPGLLAIFFTIKQKSFKIRLVVIHISLILSIALLSIAGVGLHIGFQIYAFIYLLISIIAAISILGRFGYLYIISSIIQEWCLLLAAILLGREIGIYWAAMASALVYAISHLIDVGYWQLKIFITLFWGIVSILLYNFIQQPMLNFAIHIIGGAMLIRFGLMYGTIHE